MPPYLTTAGKALLASALTWFCAAALLATMGKSQAVWPVLLGASAMLGVLIVAYFITIPVGRILDNMLQVSVKPPQAGAHLLTHDTVHPRLLLHNRSGWRLRLTHTIPEASTPLSCDAECLPSLDLDAHAWLQTAIPTTAHRSGRWFIHGIHLTALTSFSLFAVRTYKAAPLAMLFLPKPLPQAQQHQPTALTLDERFGMHFIRQRGFGTDLREIREHQPGDPFRNIAWKATARCGRLMVRDFESERAINAYLLLDISTTMRGARHQQDKLEHALRLIVDFSRNLLRGNDQCGLITFDERIYGHLPPREGRLHFQRLQKHLLGLHRVVDEGLTEYDEDEVIDALVRFLMLQFRLDFRRRAPRRHSTNRPPAIEDHIDVELLNRWLRSAIHDQAPTSLAEERVGIVRAKQLSLARHFCLLHGVEIPFRTEARFGTKEHGLVAALEAAIVRAKGPTLVLIITDLSGLMHTERLVKTLHLARAKRHKVAFLVPVAPSYVNPSDQSPEQSILHEIFAAGDRHERRRVLRALRQASVPNIEIHATDRIEPILQRLRLLH